MHGTLLNNSSSNLVIFISPFHWTALTAKTVIMIPFIFLSS
ncbi:hypothetical protein LMG9449_2515 [Lactococcus lactis subsp. lactis]|uniref:Uncharacterized protein n=1 Tax=Lactococcus lactis subsp. lactis TaxID=1360 RepID=A0A0V8DMP0_LACLL|nr:hypothetical protein LMG9449_2515 [Lactococcus lactis subsp. lactis]